MARLVAIMDNGGYVS